MSATGPVTAATPLSRPDLVDDPRALDLLRGEHFGAGQAREFGLVSRVVPAARPQDEARAVATRLTRGCPPGLLATRHAVHYNLRHAGDDMVRFEEDLCGQVFSHPDAHEGMAAFLEKRDPRFWDL